MSTFDPSKYLIKLQGRDYLEVKWRLVWLRTDHPEATIATEIVGFDVADQWAIIRATVTLPTGATATGMAFQKPTGVAKDWIANGETSAVGRALGFLGYGTQFCDEFDQGDDVVDSPVARKAAPTPTPASSRAVAGKPERAELTAVKRQIAANAETERTATEAAAVRRRLNQELLAAMADRNLPQSQVTSTMRDLWGIVRSGDLSNDQVADIIAWVRDAKQLVYGPDGKAALVDAGPGADDGLVPVEDLEFDPVPASAGGN